MRHDDAYGERGRDRAHHLCLGGAGREAAGPGRPAPGRRRARPGAGHRRARAARPQRRRQDHADAGAGHGAEAGRRAAHACSATTSRGRADLREVRRGLGYLPQQFGFYPRFTVREFVEYMAWLKEMPKPDIPGAVQRAIERVGLADRADARMKTLSGGMLRRAGIAQAIVNDPAGAAARRADRRPGPGAAPRLPRAAARDRRRQLRAGLHPPGRGRRGRLHRRGADRRGPAGLPGHPGQLAARAAPTHAGDSAAERGYSALLRAHRGRCGHDGRILRIELRRSRRR